MNSRCTNCKKKERIRINNFLYVYCVKWNSQENICCKNVSVKHRSYSFTVSILSLSVFTADVCNDKVRAGEGGGGGVRWN